LQTVRKRQDKYRRLAHGSLSDLELRQIRPNSPNYFFDEGIKGKEGEKGRPLDQIFTIGSTALQTSRDELATAHSEIDIIGRLADLRDASKPDDQFRLLLKKKKGSRLPAGDSSFWNLKDARKELRARPSVEIAPLMYRPFDVRYLIYDEGVVHRVKREVSDPMSHDNLAILVPRQLSSIEYRHVFVTQYISEMCVVSSSTKEQNRVMAFR
jgi:hypothetical protein